MLGRAIEGTCSLKDIEDGAEFTTDKDFYELQDGDILTLITQSGKEYRIFGPEKDDVNPAIEFTPRKYATLRPSIERIEPRRFRLRLTEAQEWIVKGP